MEGLTVSEMAQTLGIKEKAVKQRLYYAKRKPFISRAALYTQSDFETIKAMSKVGRPAKKEAGEGENADRD
jgi:predicted ArsR family transcriptional regulator